MNKRPVPRAPLWLFLSQVTSVSSVYVRSCWSSVLGQRMCVYVGLYASLSPAVPSPGTHFHLWHINWASCQCSVAPCCRTFAGKPEKRWLSPLLSVPSLISPSNSRTAAQKPRRPAPAQLSHHYLEFEFHPLETVLKLSLVSSSYYRVPTRG